MAEGSSFFMMSYMQYNSFIMTDMNYPVCTEQTVRHHIWCDHPPTVFGVRF
ncbi:hypothetical protein SXCC_00011 [Gluconacetobacter sp. SXCC-1]|nr:hypothetical protein SXCC_00011 [Gluconacetobacter sp. SXCC-1]